MTKGLYLSILASAVFACPVLPGQTTSPPAHPASRKAKAPAAKAAAGASAWTPDVQQYLGVQQGSFTMVGLNRLSKPQLDALVAAAKSNVYADPRKHVLTCGPAAPAQNGKTRVFVTVTGDDPTGQRATEIKQALGAIDGVELVDSQAAADRALHVVIQEQTLGKRTIGYTASYLTATPCADESLKTDAELKGQLGTYTDPRGVDLASDLAHMLDRDLRTAQPATR